VSEQDYYYVVKVKSAASIGNDEEYAEFEYRIANSPRSLPSSDDDLGFLGFEGDYKKGGVLESYVCTDVMCIDKGSRKERELKDELAKEPWERTVGGI